MQALCHLSLHSKTLLFLTTRRIFVRGTARRAGVTCCNSERHREEEETSLRSAYAQTLTEREFQREGKGALGQEDMGRGGVGSLENKIVRHELMELRNHALT